MDSENNKKIYLCANNDNQENYKKFLDDLKKDYSIIDINNELPQEKSYILIIGGDGTLNYCINKLNFEFEHNVIYIPAGTANDFAKSLNIDDSKLKPMLFNKDLFYEVISRANCVKVPVLKCNEKYILNVVSAGLAAQITDSEDSPFKKVAGEFSYYINALEKLFNPETFDFKVQCDGEKEYKIESYGFTISQGIYAGGGVKTAPVSIPFFNDKFLFVSMDSSDLVTYIKALKNFVDPKITMHEIKSGFDEIIITECEELKITSEKEIPLKLDGEELKSKSVLIKKTNKFLNFYQYNL